eukprot:3901011-Pyramimonas_sp.AAC.1
MDVIYGWFGLNLIETQIIIRALSYLGHLGRYSRERWEVGMLGAELRDGPGTLEPDRRRITLRRWHWKQIQLLMKFSSKPEPQWHQEWFQMASEENGQQRRKLCDLVKQDFRGRLRSARPPEADRPLEERPSLAAQAPEAGTAHGGTLRVCSMQWLSQA